MRFCAVWRYARDAHSSIGRIRTDFGISLPAPSADALSATLYGHSTWRPLSRADR